MESFRQRVKGFEARANWEGIYLDDTLLAVRPKSVSDDQWCTFCHHVCNSFPDAALVPSVPPAVQVDEETIARLTVRIEQLEKGMKKC